METNYTKGLWNVDPMNKCDIQCNGVEIGATFPPTAKGSTWVIEGPVVPALSEAFANARLIAAAPDLFEALNGMLAEYENGAWHGQSIKAARAALAKAQGSAD